MLKKILHIFGRVLVLAVFVGAAYLLYGILKEHTFQEVWDAIKVVSPLYIAAAVVLTLVNYLILVSYDLLAVRWVGQKLPLWKVAFASFTGYAFSYNFGATLFGTSIRYRLYSAWGVPLWKVMELLVILGLTFWFGLFALAGVVFIIDPLEVPAQFQKGVPFTDTYWAGWVLLALAVAYVGLSALHTGSIRIGKWVIPVPPFRLTVCQVLIASADFIVAAGVVYCLFPSMPDVGYLSVLGIFMLAFVVSVLTHVPGGYGVLEVMILAFIPKEFHVSVIAGLIVFRVVYYWVPLVIAAVMLGAHELMVHGEAPSPESEAPASGSQADAPD